MSAETIREWAELCTDETIRKQWIKNADKDGWADWYHNTMKISMSDALISSFDWGNSFEGYNYWDDIHDEMLDNPEKYLKKRKVMFHEDNG